MRSYGRWRERERETATGRRETEVWTLLSTGEFGKANKHPQEQLKGTETEARVTAGHSAHRVRTHASLERERASSVCAAPRARSRREEEEKEKENENEKEQEQDGEEEEEKEKEKEKENENEKEKEEDGEE